MPEKPSAVIDLGSHSALLLIAVSLPSGDLKLLHEDFRITRLGKGVKRDGLMKSENMDRAVSVLEKFKEAIDEFSCRRVYVTATAAMRTAKNSDEMIGKISEHFGWEVEILTPEQEATYSYLGAISAFKNFKNKEFIVVDSGGGSTEITMGNGTDIKARGSVPVGAARLAEEMGFKVTLCSSDRMGLMQIVKNELEKIPFWNQLDSTKVLVGSGGTITTLAAIHHGMEKYDPETINRTALDKDQIWKLYYRINELSLKERLKIKGLEKGREDVITYGTIVYLTIMELREIDLIRVSARGLRHGYLLSKFKK
ncbi:MAG: Ppx/GppA family phosphatase [Calditrichaeota bacterium]|nr:Ppx/GppA family phosphatase [Calditrichota bacterium]